MYVSSWRISCAWLKLLEISVTLTTLKLERSFQTNPLVLLWLFVSVGKTSSSFSKTRMLSLGFTRICVRLQPTSLLFDCALWGWETNCNDRQLHNAGKLPISRTVIRTQAEVSRCHLPAWDLDYAKSVLFNSRRFAAGTTRGHLDSFRPRIERLPGWTASFCFDSSTKSTSSPA